MKNIFLVLSFVISSAINSSAQITFQKIYGGVSEDRPYSVHQTTDGGYIVAGNTRSFGAGNSDFYLIKTNSSGDTLWTKTYGGINDDIANSVEQTTDGGYILAGYTNSFGAGLIDFYIVKTNSAGDTLWTKTYGGINDDVGRCVHQTTDGGYIITGNTSSFGAGVGDVWLVKTNAAGVPAWSRAYGGSSTDAGYFVSQTNDGGYIITGITSIGAGNFDVYLIKTNATGDTLWTKKYGGSGHDWGRCVKQTTDGGYIVSGRTISFGAGNDDVYLIKTNSTGDTLWTKTYGDYQAEFGMYVQQTTDGGYVIAGNTFSIGTGGYSDVYVIKTNTTGDTLWTKRFGRNYNEGDFSAVEQTADGGYIIASSMSGFSSGNYDVYLIKTDANGYSGCYETSTTTFVAATPTIIVNPATISTVSNAIAAPCSTLTGSGGIIQTWCNSIPTEINAAAIENYIFLFPNPVSSEINFSFPDAENYFLTIKNTLGKTILTKSVREKDFSVDVKDFSAGIYFVTVTDEKKNRVTKKFVKM